MTDRYDEIMLGLYQGFVPDWLPARSRPRYRRESLRRRCDLGQMLAANFRCAVYCAQSLFGPDFMLEVYGEWPASRGTASNVLTGLYCAFADVLQRTARTDAVQELLNYEALALRELRCAPRAQRVEPPSTAGDALRGAEVYRFRHAVAEYHARMTLYAGALAPAAFARAYEVEPRATFIARFAAEGGWVVQDVTGAVTARGSR